MENVLFVNTCVRENSRTRELAECVLGIIGGEVREINPEHENLKPLDGKLLHAREQFVCKNDFSDKMFRYAKEFAAADTIVIAAPYWDLAFPALLKIYLEQISVCGITFRYSKGIPQGLCRAKRLIYVTTVGGQILFNYGFDYVKALAENFYGIDEIILFKAENLDIDGNNVNKIMCEAKREIAEFFEKGGGETV